eukprot:TRINITY_DN9536_c0_g2_i2.p1 TRINITY_DN9536_c0_g2~~TRINITY_DN9536_c0_g2_i2.p1  ORF type:complete len:252 (+),score=63.89 TRINITY_DN9536_c0_g2_i2:146-901(+)
MCIRDRVLRALHEIIRHFRHAKREQAMRTTVLTRVLFRLERRVLLRVVGAMKRYSGAHRSQLAQEDRQRAAGLAKFKRVVNQLRRGSLAGCVSLMTCNFQLAKQDQDFLSSSRSKIALLLRSIESTEKKWTEEVNALKANVESLEERCQTQEDTIFDKDATIHALVAEVEMLSLELEQQAEAIAQAGSQGDARDEAIVSLKRMVERLSNEVSKLTQDLKAQATVVQQKDQALAKSHDEMAKWLACALGDAV